MLAYIATALVNKGPFYPLFPRGDVKRLEFLKQIIWIWTTLAVWIFILARCYKRAMYPMEKELEFISQSFRYYCFQCQRQLETCSYSRVIADCCLYLWARIRGCGWANKAGWQSIDHGSKPSIPTTSYKRNIDARDKEKDLWPSHRILIRTVTE